MGFKAKARKNKAQSSEDGANKKKASQGQVQCAIKNCDKYADKKLGGRSLSFDDSTEMWGSGSFVATKGRVRVCKSCYRSWKKENKNDDMY